MKREIKTGIPLSIAEERQMPIKEQVKAPQQKKKKKRAIWSGVKLKRSMSRSEIQVSRVDKSTYDIKN